MKNAEVRSQKSEVRQTARRLLLIAGLWSLISGASAQWTNPSPTGAVSVAIMSDTNGNIKAPLKLTGQRWTSSELSLSGDLISHWSDISTLYGTYVTAAANAGTAPSAPYGYAALSKSGASVYLHSYMKGQGGVTVSNDANGTVYFDGGLTNGVDALFPTQTGSTTRLYYRSVTAPHAMVYVDFAPSTNGYLYTDGTNFYPLTALVSTPTATNAALLNSQPGSYYLDRRNSTNFPVFDDGGLVDANVTGIDAGTNLVVTIASYTNAGMVYRVAKINAGTGTASNTLWYSDNTWYGANVFTRPVSLLNFTLTGDGNTRGSFGTVAGGTNNTAGSYSSVAGGANNSAGGSYSFAAGGDNNSAAGTYSFAAGHRVYSAGARSFTFGEYADNSSNNVAFFAWGQADTNHAAATLATNGIEVAGAVKANTFIGDGSLLTGITAGNATNATLLNGLAGLAQLVGRTNVTVTISGTNIYLDASGGGSGTLTGAVVGAGSSTRLMVTNDGSANITLHLDTTGLATGTPVYVEADTLQSVMNRGSLASNNLTLTNAALIISGASNASQGYVQFPDGTKQYSAGVAGGATGDGSGLTNVPGTFEWFYEHTTTNVVTNFPTIAWNTGRYERIIITAELSATNSAAAQTLRFRFNNDSSAVYDPYLWNTAGTPAQTQGNFCNVSYKGVFGTTLAELTDPDGLHIQRLSSEDIYVNNAGAQVSLSKTSTGYRTPGAITNIYVYFPPGAALLTGSHLKAAGVVKKK